jgi:hypothetical protein
LPDAARHRWSRYAKRWVGGFTATASGQSPGVVPGIDRKAARRYIAAAIEVGVIRNGDESQLTDEVVGQVCERVRPRRLDGHGDSWRALLAHEERIESKGCSSPGVTA